jgi:hypothetical protein
LIDACVRHELIARAAYFRAQQRGFETGHEQQDWYAAEAEVDAALGVGGQSVVQGSAPRSSETT